MELGKLNSVEEKVLADLFESSKETGHDFGFTDHISCVEKSKRSGYVSQLVQKNYFTVYECEGEKFCQFIFSNAYKRKLGLFQCAYSEDYIEEVDDDLRKRNVENSIRIEKINNLNLKTEKGKTEYKELEKEIIGGKS